VRVCQLRRCLARDPRVVTGPSRCPKDASPLLPPSWSCCCGNHARRDIKRAAREGFMNPTPAAGELLLLRAVQRVLRLAAHLLAPSAAELSFSVPGPGPSRLSRPPTFHCRRLWP